MYRSSCRELLLPLVVAFATCVNALAQAPLLDKQDAAQVASHRVSPKALSQRCDEVNRSIASGNLSGEEAAQALLEVAMHANVAQDRATGDRIRIRLVLDYPATIPARYLFAQFPDEATYRNLLLQAWNIEPRALSDEFYRKFHAALRAGAARWKSTFLADDYFLLVAAVAALRVGDAPLLDLVRQKLSKAEKEPGEIAGIVLGDLPAGEKFARLVPFCDRVAAPDFCDDLYLQIPARERETAALMAARVRQFLAAHRYSDALLPAEALVALDPTPLHRLWLAWAQTLTHNGKDALRTLDAIGRAGKSHELAVEYRQLKSVAANLQANRDAHVQAAGKAIGLMSWFGALQSVEFNARFGDQLRYGGYVGIDLWKKTIAVSLVKSGEPALSCRLEKGISKFHARGDARVIAYRELHAFPVLTVDLKQTADGSITFNANVTAGKSPYETSTAIRKLFQTPFLASEEGLQGVAKSWIDRGWAPMPAEVLKETSERRFRWISLNRDFTGHQTCDVHLSGDDRLTAIRQQSLEVTAIRYGRSDSFKLNLPPLPEHPVEWRETLDASNLLQALARAAAVWNDDATRVSARPN